jgi:glycosyltransferase involved in cell wall biosynthesis
MTASRQRLLVISQDRLGAEVGGTSIRAIELARQLSKDHDVTLAGVGTTPPEVAGLPSVGYLPHAPRDLAPHVKAADAVFSLPQWPLVMRLLRRSRARLVFDLYVPQSFEIMGGFPGDRSTQRRVLTEYSTDRLVDALRSGHQFVCASEKQRDLWLGVLLAERLIDARRRDQDPSLRSLIDVVPFGLPAESPRPSGEGGPRTRFPGLGEEAEIVLWGGGLWPWLDAGTAIRAVALLAQRRPSARLVFMGNAPQLPAQRTAARARALAAELGVLGSVVLFNDGWVPYEQRADWLLEASCGISCHEDHLETRFAFRTRLLDCFWARLPVVCTAGDELAETVERSELGAVVPPGDPEAAAAALERVLDRGKEAYREGLDRIAAEYSWDQVASPLRRLLAGPPPPAPPRRSRRPAHVGRELLYRAGRSVLNAVGVREWPRL